MTWAALVRPALRETGPYVPGPSLDELMARHGLAEVAKLNWNEGLWGPLPGVRGRGGRRARAGWAYPEHAYNELREAIAAETGVGRAGPAGPRDPGPGRWCCSRRSCGPATPSRCPSPPTSSTPRPRRWRAPASSGCRRARSCASTWSASAPPRGARTRGSPGSATPTTRRARGSTRTSGGRCSTPCRPAAWSSPTRPTWTTSSPRSGRGRERDVAEGRRVVVLRTFSKLFGLAGLRLGYAIADPELVRLLHRGAGAVQRQPGGARRGARVARPPGRRGGAARAAARPPATASRRRSAVGGMRPLPSHGELRALRGRRRRRALGERLLRRGVLVRTGRGLGLPGWARITVGPDPLMDRAAAALLAARAELLAEAA